MKSASLELQKRLEDAENITYSAQITFANNDVLTLTEDDLSGSGCRITISPGSDSLPLGSVIAKVLTLSFFNLNDRFSDYDFFGASITVTGTVQLTNGTENVNLGRFTVTEPETYGETITITAYDDIWKLDKPFETSLSFPMLASELFAECCSRCGLSVETASFYNSNFEVVAPESGKSFREVVGMIASLACGNAIMGDTGLKIVSYSPVSVDALGFTDGGTFDEGTPKYESGAAVDGGDFNPWNTGDVLDGGSFQDLRNIQLFTEPITQSVTTDDVIITGVRVKNSDEASYLYGAEGYVIETANSLAAGLEEEAATAMGGRLIGLRFRPFTLTRTSYPLAEFCDACYISHKGNLYASFVTDIDFKFKGTTELKCSADSPVRNSTKGNAAVAASTEQMAKRLVEQERSARTQAEHSMRELLNSKAGLYPTIEETQSGNIYYLHDQPTLATSKTVIKITDEAIGMTNNYIGEYTQWNIGLSVNGTVIANILSAIGVSFDWARGGTLTLGGNNNQNGILRMMTQAGVEFARWDKSGLTVNNGKFAVDANGNATVMSLTAYGSLICYENYTIT